MGRRLLGILRVGSLLLFAGTIGLWGRSYIDPMATVPSTAAMQRQLARQLSQVRFDQGRWRRS